MFHSNEELQDWLKRMRALLKDSVDNPIKSGGWVSEREASNIIKATRERAMARLDAQRRVQLPSAAYEAAVRDVRGVLARYTPAEPVTGYINVFGWRATNV